MTPLHKNQIYELTIETLSKKGVGIGYLNSKPVYVKNTLPGEEINVKIIKITKQKIIGKCLNLT